MATENITISKQDLLKAYREAKQSQKEFMKQLFGADTFASNVMERIKTFDDAYNELALRTCGQDASKSHPVIQAYDLMQFAEDHNNRKAPDDIKAFLQLCIITAALNEGWTPQFTESETRWYPYFTLWTEDELKNKSDEWKDDHQLLLWGGNASSGSNCGVAYSNSDNEWSYTIAGIGSRLAYKTEALATFAGRTFAPVYARFFLGDKAEGLKPWREVEGKEEPADEAHGRNDALCSGRIEPEGRYHEGRGEGPGEEG